MKQQTNMLCQQVWKVFKVFNIQLQWKSSKLHVSMAPDCVEDLWSSPAGNLSPLIHDGFLRYCAGK